MVNKLSFFFFFFFHGRQRTFFWLCLIKRWLVISPRIWLPTCCAPFCLSLGLCLFKPQAYLNYISRCCYEILFKYIFLNLWLKLRNYKHIIKYYHIIKHVNSFWADCSGLYFKNYNPHIWPTWCRTNFKLVGRCLFVLESKGSNLAFGMDVRSR